MSATLLFVRSFHPIFMAMPFSGGCVQRTRVEPERGATQRSRRVISIRGLDMSVYARNISVHTHIVNRSVPMPSKNLTRLPECNCLALRQAARHVTQFYDQYLASTGLRSTQFSILAKLQGLGPTTINALARELVMDRTTLGRTRS